ncbi:MAG: yrrB [Verrucomicrobia bacterium]|nr:yrrB [Verrucomicrobiota bacterium]
MDQATPKIDRGVILAWVIIILAAWAAYGNSFAGPFVFDGQATIRDNPSIRQLWPLGPALSPPSDGSPVSGRPIANLSFALNHAVGGFEVRGYHALNLAIHILAGLTFFGIMRRTLAGIPAAQAAGFGSRRDWAPLAAAVIWTVHPLQTEAVTYLAQRSESLMGLFYFLTLYGFIRGGEGRGPAGKMAYCWLGLSWLACLLGMATKEVMASAPAMVFLYDRTFVAGSFRTAWNRRRVYYAGLFGTWLLLIGLMVQTGSRGGTVGFHTNMPWWDYALHQSAAIVHYLRLSVWPHPLVIDYGLTWGASPLMTALDGLIVAGLVGATGIAIWRRSALGFLGAWFFAILAPSSSVVPIATEIVAEHRMYLPLAALVVLVVLGSWKLFGGKSLPLFVVLALGLIGVTWRRNEDYRSERALWAQTVEAAPRNPGAHNNLAKALLEEKDFSGADREFTEALRLNPNLPGAWNNAGALRLHEGKVLEAIAAYENALRLVPDYADARAGLGRALVQAGRLPEAILQFERTLALRPDSVETHNFLAFAWYKSGRKEEAIAEYRNVLRLKPDHSEAGYNLANLLAQSGRVAESVGYFEQILRIKPDWLEARINLGSAFIATGRIAEAIAQFEAAVRLRPDYAAAHYDLAIALRTVGREEEAKAEFETAAKLGVTPP